MARATRSSINQDKSPQKLPDSKKRKRISDSADEPAQKLQRTNAPPYAATSPIDPHHAHQILNVLHIIDSQGLLDRVYPLEQSSSSAHTYSLRDLLEKAQDHTLATLRTAVQNLLPISVHPRAATPAPAEQQQRFCDVALSLLDQASFHPVALDIESLLPQEPADEDEPSKQPVATSNKRYALMQHLPSGDYWTSANLPLSATPETGPADLKDLPTGHADLVAIFPAPSAASTSALPKLGDYHRQPYDPTRPKIVPTKRRVTCGSFLDYGPWASFAPTWDHNGREIGMRQMGEVYAQKAQRYHERLAARQRAIEELEELEKSAVEVPMEPPPPPPEEQEQEPPDVDALKDILTPTEITSLKAVLGSLELENAVQELLNRNRKALQRLGQLQVQRLRAEGGRTSTVAEGDEEWDVAHGILDSLALLASLRPRSSADPVAPLVPPPAALHALMNTLPRAAVPGWHGTLPARGAQTPASALRDDSTVKVRPGVPATAPPPAPVPTTPAATQPYGAYGGYYAQTVPRPAAGGQYQYNSRAPAPAQGQQQQQQNRQYYAQGYAGSNQLPYGYTATAGWYGSYGAGTGTATGPNTPTAAAGAASYSTFSGAWSGASTPVPGGKAVANTVVGKGGVGAGQGQGQWGTQTQAPPVLPAHLRTTGSYYTPS
ncbi:hypothetical protein DFH07DRAFT_1062520 [Mycena maculata]|uniref:Uncharacterized protein n=1 Tax=Mycena maculata TaxID=230809 RepID=A0AAD7ISK8_9AGAR|nr:hypothetical protein DFH07DRAFT_1062520 [Mycena maculata]